MRLEERTTGFYLALEPGGGAVERLHAALSAAPLQAVLILAVEGKRLDPAAARELVEAAQARNCAALIEEDARLARNLKADGLHLAGSPDIADRYADARNLLGSQSIIGAIAGQSRHEAMVLAEAGADYIGFGLPAGLQSVTSASDRRLELVAWWAEIFQVPCVAFDVFNVDEAVELAGVGADFLGLPLASHETPAKIAERLRAIDGAVSSRNKQPVFARERD